MNIAAHMCSTKNWSKNNAGFKTDGTRRYSK